MKKTLSVLLTLCLFVNVSFAFDPYADEEVEKKSYKKLYYGIALTLLGGFLAYDGFSEEEVDVSKPRVDYLTVSHSEWILHPGGDDTNYQIRSGISLNNDSNQAADSNSEQNNDPNQGADSNSEQGDIKDYTIYEIPKEGYNPEAEEYDPTNFDRYSVEPNILYNTGNVDLRDITIEVRYKYVESGTYIGPEGAPMTAEGYYIDVDTGERKLADNQGFHTAETNKSQSTDTETVETAVYKDIPSLKKGEHIPWQDIWEYPTDRTSQPEKDKYRKPYFYNSTTGTYNSGTDGLHLGKDSATLMEVRVKLKKNINYTPIYEKRHKSDLEGVAGIFVGLAGIYFIVDHFVDLHKFNVYAKKHSLNLRFATVSNGYKLMLQKRI